MALNSSSRKLAAATVALLVGSALLLLHSSLPAQEVSFRRGDSNVDGNFDISDPIFTMRMIFLGDASPGCDDAADVDDDGELGVTDGIFSMRCLFLDGPPPPAPFDDCGLDVSADPFTCTNYPACAGDELCIDQGTIDELLGQSLSFTFCIPAGLATLPVNPFTIAICPSEGAQPCGLTQLAGCAVEISSITASVDVLGRRLLVRFEGRVNALPIAVTESIFNTTTTCTTNIHGQDPNMPFSFEAVIPLEVVTILPGIEEVTGTGAGTVENVDLALTSTGGLVCVLFQAGQAALLDPLVSQLATLTNALSENLGSQLVGLRLCR